MPRKSNTRAAQGSGTIRQRPDGRWEARFFVNGQRRSVYGTTQKEVRQKLTAATSDVDNGVYMQPSHLTLDAWADTWKKTYLTDVKPGTLHTYTYLMDKYLRPALGKIKLAALTAPAIQAVYNKLLKDGLSHKYVRDIHGVLHRCLSDAVAVGYLRANPADACKLPKKDAPQLAPFDEAQIGAFLTAIQGHRLEAVLCRPVHRSAPGRGPGPHLGRGRLQARADHRGQAAATIQRRERGIHPRHAEKQQGPAHHPRPLCHGRSEA